MKDANEGLWHYCEVTSPQLQRPVTVLAAKGVSYVPDANRLQNLNIYLPDTPEAANLVGKPATSLLTEDNGDVVHYLVHIHGGAWRDPQLNAESIEPAVAHAYSRPDGRYRLKAIASINYTISQFPTHSTQPYDLIQSHGSDPAREAVHPQHVKDVLDGLRFLKTLGIAEHSYILSGHSCGACIAFQAILQSPAYYGLNTADGPCPAAMVGLNGLYDLPALVNDLGASHEHLGREYRTILSNAFGKDEAIWADSSPARFDPSGVAERVRDGLAPHLILIDQSPEDQLVPMNQVDRFEAHLSESKAISVIRGTRCIGGHAAPWEQGLILWASVQDTLTRLRDVSSDRSQFNSGT